MRKNIERAVKCAALLAFCIQAQAAPPAIEHAAQVLGVAKIQSLEFEAAGKYFQFTQAPAPDLPWPPFDVDGYKATLDYTRGAVHARYHRVQVQEPGRARPHAEATQDQFAVNGVSWNLAPGPTAIPSNLAERNAELWASPQGFVKAALEHASRVSRQGGGNTHVAVNVGGSDYEGVISAAGEVLSVRAMMDSNVLGDTAMEWRYSQYRDFDGVRFPARIERRIDNLPWYDLTVTAVRINNAVPFDVPPAVAANPAPSMSLVDVTELAPGVFNFGGGSHNSVVIEQANGIVVVEAPLGEERSLAVIAKVHELFPGRKISAVINTHAHFDHAGGLRTFVAEGVKVITHERNAAYYARVWKRPHSLNPDRLAVSKRKPEFETFTVKHVLDDVSNPIEIHAIERSGHNDAFAMVYLPSVRILIEADAWTPTPAGATPPAVINPLWINLYRNIERLQLDIQRFVPLHGSPQRMADFRKALRLPD